MNLYTDIQDAAERVRNIAESAGLDRHALDGQMDSLIHTHIDQSVTNRVRIVVNFHVIDEEIYEAVDEKKPLDLSTLTRVLRAIERIESPGDNSVIFQNGWKSGIEAARKQVERRLPAASPTCGDINLTPGAGTCMKRKGHLGVHSSNSASWASREGEQ